MPIKGPRTAEEFLEEQARIDPEYFQELAEKYPIQTAYAKKRDAIGMPLSRKRKIEGLKGGIPKHMKRKFTDDEWKESRSAVERGRREHMENARYAQELADEGMRGY